VAVTIPTPSGSPSERYRKCPLCKRYSVRSARLVWEANPVSWTRMGRWALELLVPEPSGLKYLERVYFPDQKEEMHGPWPSTEIGSTLIEWMEQRAVNVLLSIFCGGYEIGTMMRVPEWPFRWWAVDIVDGCDTLTAWDWQDVNLFCDILRASSSSFPSGANSTRQPINCNGEELGNTCLISLEAVRG